MASVYGNARLNFLSVNMSCHDGLGEGYWVDGRFAYIGSCASPFQECVDDIAGAVTFAERFSDRIVLQGHSLGCDRVLQYSIDLRSTCDLVLLAPCDSYQLQADWIAPETVEAQIARLRSGAGSDTVLDWLPAREYGIRCRDEWTYSIPVTRRAFLSIAEGPPYRLMRVSRPTDFFLA